VAGNFQWPQLRDHVSSLFGSWKPLEQSQPAVGGTRPPYDHIPFESGQTHIGIVYPWISVSDPDFFQARAAIGVMSDGMSSRLFTEVREKRGLCYTVFATLHSLKEDGSILAYAGTSSERAQESLDVMLQEFDRLIQFGVQPQEVTRLKARFKSGIVMQQESSSSRANSLASDWYHLGRTRSREELASLIDEVTCDSINEFLSRRPPGPYRVTTVGPQPLEVSL
jgi:predicted Zn-dependent peptidase